MGILKVREGVYNLDFGNRVKGSKIEQEISLEEFKDISRVTASCGCTVPTIDYKTDPPTIKITYNSQRVGKISQRVTVLMKSGSKLIINVLGNVS